MMEDHENLQKRISITNMILRTQSTTEGVNTVVNHGKTILTETGLLLEHQGLLFSIHRDLFNTQYDLYMTQCDLCKIYY